MADPDLPLDELTDELEDDGVVWLVDTEGNEVGFGMLGMLDHDGQDYILLSPLAQLEDDDEEQPLDVLIMQYDFDEEDGAESYTPIEDESLFEKLSKKAEAVLDAENV